MPIKKDLGVVMTCTEMTLAKAIRCFTGTRQYG